MTGIVFFMKLPIAFFFTIPFFLHVYSFYSYEDLKYITFIIILTPLVLSFLSQYKPSKHIGKNGNSIVFFSLFTGLFCFTLINWYVLGNPYYGNRSVILFWVSLLCFFTGTLLSDEKIKDYLLPTGILVGSLAATIAIFEYAGYIRTTSGYFPPQPSGFIGHKNMLALVLMACVIWTFFAATKKIQTEKKIGILLFVLSFIQLVALVISDSRGPMLTSIVVLLTIFFFRFASHLKHNSSLRITLYLSFLLFGLLPLLLWDENTWFRYASLFMGRDTANVTQDNSFRPILFKSMISLFLEKPVFGIGVGNFIPHTIRFWPLQLRTQFQPFLLADAGHNDFLQAWCELGLIGGTLYNFFWFGALFIALKKFIKTKSLESLVLFLAFASIFLHAGYNTASRHVPSSVIAWVHMGLIWKDHFTIPSVLTSKKGRQIVTIVIIFFSSLFLFLAIQISIGDFFFFKSEVARTNKQSIQTQNTMLLKSIKYCPYHPNANYKLSHFNALNNNFEVALKTSDYLDEKYPNTLPTDYVRSYCHYHKENYDSTIYYSNRILNLWPKYTKVYIYQALAYQKLENCQELNRLKKIISPGKKSPSKRNPEKNHPIKKPNNESIEKAYINKLSMFQKKFGGPFIKNSYKIHRYTPLIKYDNLKKSYKKILELECDTTDSLNN